jgi:Domain of unknown function (4846)
MKILFHPFKIERNFQKYRFMLLHCPLIFFWVHFISCQLPEKQAPHPVTVAAFIDSNAYTHVEAIPLPAGYSRVPSEKNSFTHWLRQIPLKANKTVFLYNGQLKLNQQAQFAVLDVTVGKKDLQQCADAIMRLRAEYLYSHKQFTAIDFIDNENNHYRFTAIPSRQEFNRYLDRVFAYCGSLSLSTQLEPVANFDDIQPGDVLIKGGSPGHAMQVVDVAIDKKGNKIYLLSQSYMPAQDIHVVINPTNNFLSPWYGAGELETIQTPEWTFKTSQLKRWPGK